VLSFHTRISRQRLTIAVYSTRIVKFVICQTGWFLLRVREVAAAHWCFHDPYVQVEANPISVIGLTACSGDSWRDTVENTPMIVCVHACGGTDGACHAANDLPGRLSRVCTDASLARPRPQSCTRRYAVPDGGPRRPCASLSRRSCTRSLRIIPLPLKPATMPRLTMPERGQYHGFTPFLLPTRSGGPRVALRHAACCRVSPRGSDTTDSDAHQAQK
jgi:hypothetical protein